MHGCTAIHGRCSLGSAAANAKGSLRVRAQPGFGLPVPRRRTFTPPILGSALSMLTALRHPWLRWSATPALRKRV